VLFSRPLPTASAGVWDGMRRIPLPAYAFLLQRMPSSCKEDLENIRMPPSYREYIRMPSYYREYIRMMYACLPPMGNECLALVENT
jgi:hypothetical protein